MSRPDTLKTRIFLDGGDPAETREVLDGLGFLDGQTTNPTLVSKNPDAQSRLQMGQKFTPQEIFDFYKGIVQQISNLVPQGSVSIEVYADAHTTAEQMVEQAKQMTTWIPNAHIKYPTTKEGLRAAQQSIYLGMNVNMTLVFSQEQAAAVYAATKGAKRGQVFVSPFVGRLDDTGLNGMELIYNIQKMYQQGDGHVMVLAASVRNIDHLMKCLHMQADIVTAPYKLLREWIDNGIKMPEENYIYPIESLQVISYQEINLEKEWHEYNITHALTDAGITKFAADWNSLIQITPAQQAPHA